MPSVAEENKRIGTKAKINRKYKCLAESGTCVSSFDSVGALNAHREKCHRYVICGGCHQRVRFACYTDSHLKTHRGCVRFPPCPCTPNGSVPADWSLSTLFLERFRTRMDDYCSSMSGPMSSKIQNTQSEDQTGGSKVEQEEDCNFNVLPVMRFETKVTGNEEVDNEAIETVQPNLVHYVLTDVPWNPPNDFLSDPEDFLGDTDSLNNIPPSFGHPNISDHAGIMEQNNEMETTKKRKLSESFPTENSTQKSKRWYGNKRLSVGSQKKKNQQDLEGNEYPNTLEENQHQAADALSVDVNGNEKELINQSSSVGSSNNEAVGSGGKQLVFDYQLAPANLRLCYGEETFNVNRCVMQLWHLIHIRSRDDILNLSTTNVKSNVLKCIIQFLHDGVGLSTWKELILFLEGRPLDVINKIVICMIILTTIRGIPIEDLICVSNSAVKLEDISLMTLMKLCCIREILRFVIKYGDSQVLDKHQLPDYVQPFLNQVVNTIDDVTSQNYCNTLQLSALEEVILLEVSENDIRMKHRPCILHFDYTTAQVSATHRRSFLFNAFEHFLRNSASNALGHVFSLNSDPFRTELDQSFEFNIITGSFPRKVLFYIHSVVLNIRLKLDQSASENSFVAIQENLREPMFNALDISYFWEFLYNDHRPEDWEACCSVDKVVELCLLFGFNHVPMFLYGEDFPRTSQMMARFLNVYLLANDDRNLSQMCKLLLSNPKLITELDIKQMHDLLTRDGLNVNEMDVYKLVVLFSCRDDDNQTIVTRERIIPVFRKLGNVVRYGIMTLDQLQQVDTDNYLDRTQCVFFKNNITWNMHPDYVIQTSSEFHKPYERRVFNSIVQLLT